MPHIGNAIHDAIVTGLRLGQRSAGKHGDFHLAVRPFFDFFRHLDAGDGVRMRRREKDAEREFNRPFGANRWGKQREQRGAETHGDKTFQHETRFHD